MIFLLITALLPALFLVGVVFIIIASKGTYATEQCSCGYDLSGLPHTSLRCPECGARRGHFSIRSPRLFWAGVGLVLLLPITVLAGAMISLTLAL